MNLEIDHIFICTSPGAPEAEHITNFGLTEGTPNQHPGQGTACRRFFFHNAMLEPLWVKNKAEVRSEATCLTHLWERWSKRRSGASPFGVCFRPAEANQSSPPFPSWDYRPLYLPPPHAIKIADDTPLIEPMWFYLNFSRRPDSAPPEHRQSMEHPNGLREMTRISISVQDSDRLSPTARMIEQVGLLNISSNPESTLELGFDSETTGEGKDFRPYLPIVFHW